MSKKKIIEINVGIVFIIIAIGLLIIKYFAVNLAAGILLAFTIAACVFFIAGIVLFAFEKKEDSEHNHESEIDENEKTDENQLTESSDIEEQGFTFGSNTEQDELEEDTETTGFGGAESAFSSSSATDELEDDS